MCAEVTPLGKPSVTHLTFEWSLTRVHTKVLLEGAFTSESLAADSAGKWFLTRVYTKVLLEEAFMSETLAADCAGDGSLTSVIP